jgi:hypothetical protein
MTRGSARRDVFTTCYRCIWWRHHLASICSRGGWPHAAIARRWLLIESEIVLQCHSQRKSLLQRISFRGRMKFHDRLGLVHDFNRSQGGTTFLCSGRNDVQKVRLHCPSMQASAPKTLLRATFSLEIQLVVLGLCLKRKHQGTDSVRLVEEEGRRERAARLTKKVMLPGCERDCWKRG